MSTTTFRDVAMSLSKLISDNITELSDTGAIVFESPAELSAGATPQLSLFFYQVKRNAAMRNMPPETINLSQIQDTPLFLDMKFLMTLFTTDSDLQFTLTEKIMQTMFDNRVLKGDLLEGNLATTGNEELRILPDDVSLDEINKLWQAFPNTNYRLALSYTVSPVRVLSTKITDVTRVVEKRIEYSVTGE